MGRDFLEWRRNEVVGERTVLGTGFREIVEPFSADALLDLSPRLSLFNKLRPESGDDAAIFAIEKGRNAANRLVFIHSNLGNHYYLGDRRKISYFQQQPDYYNRTGDFNGIGRFLLLRVQHPSDQLYLRVSVSKTLMGGGRNTWSPGAAVIGKSTVPLGAVGSGALNRIAGPVSPVWLDGAAYIALDFDQPAMPYPIVRTGLKALYNTNVNLDYRRLVGYARDISAISPEEREALPRPRSLSRFPLDLVQAVGLEYSGIYEDGWLSPDSEFVLGAAHPGESVMLRGYVPKLAGAKPDGDLLVTINGSSKFRVSAHPGPFNWVVPVAEPGRTTRVALHFTSSAAAGEWRRPARRGKAGIARHRPGAEGPLRNLPPSVRRASHAKAWIRTAGRRPATMSRYPSIRRCTRSGSSSNTRAGPGFRPRAPSRFRSRGSLPGRLP